MVVRIGSIFESLGAQRQLGRASDAQASTQERLASGLRINHASDDAAGLAIAQSLNTRERVYTAAIRNLSDGVSLLTIADSALANLGDVITRITELAEQAANGSYSDTQRLSLDKEGQALALEYNRILDSTTFNGKAVFEADPANSKLVLQAGFGSAESLQLSVGASLTRSYSGTGAFGVGTTVAAVTNFGIVSANAFDVTGDGIADLISDRGGVGAISVNRGNADGTYAAAVSYSSGNTNHSDFTFGDVNGDGLTDVLALSAGFSQTSFSVLLGRSDGTLSTGITYQANGGNGNRSTIELADLDNDGDLDVISTAYNESTMNVNLNNGNGTFGARISFSFGSTNVDQARVADLNNDGNLDIVSVPLGGSGAAVYTVLGNGDGTFGPVQTLNVGFADRFDLGDVNGDGRVDLVLGGNNAAIIYSGQGNGTFNFAVSLAFTGSNGITLTDHNKDGKLDILSPTTNGAIIRFGNGNGTFGAVISSTIPGNANAATADLNGDGVLDFVQRNGPGGSLITFLAEATPSLHLGEFSLATQASARSTLTAMTSALSSLIAERGAIGSQLSRVSVAMNQVRTTNENYASAKSRILDADLASESAEYVRLSIVQKSAAGVLAQANIQPEIALRLING